MAATTASRMLSRSVTTAAGSPPSIASGSGSSHGTSRCSIRSSPGSELGAPRPIGSGRRLRDSSAFRHAFVAILCSQVRIDDRPSKRSYERHARTYVSCTRSSAS